MKLTAILCLLAATLAVGGPNPDQGIAPPVPVGLLDSGVLPEPRHHTHGEPSRSGHVRHNANVNPEPRIGTTVGSKGGPSRRNPNTKPPVDLDRADPPIQFDPQPPPKKPTPDTIAVPRSFPRNAHPEPGLEETRPIITRSDWPPPIRV
ncbi:hypothetical protein ASPCADRAFT_3368 [Aspergillus carbonarius ITEM 5010]|uniref:Uncharacterized protein n=1 Tax=Aspergillus carbonarius (strain ITEM 5010) TaxID=602072 RepID=A0A1R3RUX5_ASPC5|nr:hypothetical protein ASPCADRAFT_3368 [Aspergillus carbonarius ITEM 5010]